MILYTKSGEIAKPESIFQGYSDTPDDFDYTEMLRATAEAERMCEENLTVQAAANMEASEEERANGTDRA